MLLTDRSHERERLVERIGESDLVAEGHEHLLQQRAGSSGVLRIVCMSVFRWSTGWVFD